MVILGFQCFIVVKQPSLLGKGHNDYLNVLRTIDLSNSEQSRPFESYSCLQTVKRRGEMFEEGSVQLSREAPSPIISDQSRISLKA